MGTIWLLDVAGRIVGVIAILFISVWILREVVVMLRELFTESKAFMGYVIFRHQWSRDYSARQILRGLRQAEKMHSELDTTVNTDRLREYRRLADEFLGIVEN